MPKAKSASRLIDSMTDNYSEVEQIVSAFFEKWQRQMKMAMVIVTVLIDFEKRGMSMTEDEAAEHLYRLIDEGDFATFGNIKKWRHSEIVPRAYLKAN